MASFVPAPLAGGNVTDLSWLRNLPSEPAAAALAYHAHGWHPIALSPLRGTHCACPKGSACRRPGKHPWVSTWTEPASREAIEGWFTARPNAGVGVLTGHGFWVLDIDGAEGVTSLAALEAEHGPLPPTLRVRTGSGGWHVYFRLPEGERLPSRTRFAPGLDTRADGGQVVAPPSRHASGERYHVFLLAPLLEAPAWLLARVANAGAKAPSSPSSAPPPEATALPAYERARRYLARMPPAITGQGGDAHTYRAACVLVIDYGFADGEALTLLREWNARCQPPWTEAELRAKLRSARKHGRGEVGRLAAQKPLRLVTPPRAPASTTPPVTELAAPPKPPPTIVVRPQEHLVNDEAITALAHAPNIFQRLGQLVHIVTDGSKLAGVVRPAGEPRIVPLPLARLREVLAEQADWRRVVTTKHGTTDEPTHPPAWCVQAVAARGQWDPIRPLEAVVEAPMLRPDGTVLTRAGYDAATGLLYQPTGPVAPIAERLDRDDAVHATATLLDVVCDFPFETPAHRAAWLAALVTPFALYTLDGPSPLFLIDANTRGAGKTQLLKVLWQIAFGRRVRPFPAARDNEEERKRLMAIALAGLPAICIDNVEGTLGTPALDMVLTSQAVTDRVLGETGLVTAPLVATWFATGNNVQLHGDTVRRTCHVRLASPEENPEERRGFRHPDLLAYVRAQRPHLLAACVTILRAYIIAGQPDQALRPWGSFEAWSRLVRNALVWAGQPDPGETRQALTESTDTERGGLAGLLSAWEAADPQGHGLTVAQVLRWLSPLTNPDDRDPAMPSREVCNHLRDALSELCPARDGKLASSKGIGMKLQQLRGRFVGGRALNCRRNRLNTTEWFVTKGSRLAGTAGTLGT